MRILNLQIYSYAEQLLQLNISNIKMPVRINFFLQKNIQKIIEAGKEIDKSRYDILNEYGQLNADNNFDILNENLEIVEKELNDLFNLEQDIDIHIFKLDDFDGIELTIEQLSAIMFMIEE